MSLTSLERRSVCKIKRAALVTGANQGIGVQNAKALSAKNFTILGGSRALVRGHEAAKTIDEDAHATIRQEQSALH